MNTNPQPQPQQQPQQQSVLDNLKEKTSALLNKGINNTYETLDSLDVSYVPTKIGDTLTSVSNTLTNVGSRVAANLNPKNLKEVAVLVTNELDDPKTKNIINNFAEKTMKTAGDAALTAAAAAPVGGPLVVAAIKSAGLATNALEAGNAAAEKALKPANELFEKNIPQPQTQGGGFRLKGILRRSKTIEKRTSDSIDKFLNPKHIKTKTGRRKKTTTRRLSKNKTRKRVRFRL